VNTAAAGTYLLLYGAANTAITLAWSCVVALPAVDQEGWFETAIPPLNRIPIAISRKETMQNHRFIIRTMTRQEIDLAIDWAAVEGWNPGLDDADCFYAADPDGFMIGLLDEEPIAALSTVRYGETFAFIGFYLVRPDYRGQGYGLQLWKAGLAHLQGRTIGLDGVLAQQDNYRRSGFQLAYRNIRYQGSGGGPVPGGVDIVPLSAFILDAIYAYDQPFFPDDRRRFLQCWIAQPHRTALGIQRQGQLVAYGVLRPCRSGFKIGPLFADRPEWAETLFLALKAQATAGAPLYLDVPELNPAAVALAERQGMTVVFETARMYRGPAPELPIHRLFGVTTFELG
jgi:ribosomal protein S18 acetylase RimI-like enzyme